MSKKILCVLMSVLLLIGCLAVTVSAVEEKDTVALVNCDSAFGSFSLNKAQKTEGKGSLELPMKDESFKFANSLALPAVKNVDNCDTLAFDIYLTSPSEILSTFSEFTIELTSSGKYDSAEVAFIIHGDLKGYASSMQPGWNTVYFYFNNVNYTNNPDPVDLTKINFVRIFGTSVGGAGLSKETMLIDNLRVCNTGGPSFEDLENLEQFRGDNADVDISVDGMDAPDVDNRHNEITISQGEKLDASEKVSVTDNGLNLPSVSVNPDEQPTRPNGGNSSGVSNVGGADDSGVTVDGEEDMTLVLVIVICAAVLVIAVAVLALVLVLSKTKKK